MPNRHAPSPNTVIWAIVAVVIAALMGATAVLLFAPGTDIAPLLTIVAPTVAALGALAAAAQSRTASERVGRDVDELRNGLMDSKIRAGVADVIPDHLLDNDYARHRLMEDRVRAAAAKADVRKRRRDEGTPDPS